MIGALRSERLKLRRSSASRLPLIAVVAAALQGALFLLSRQAIHTWDGLTAWHALWITFLAPLSLGLLAGLTTRREARARGGGTWWRATPWLNLHAAEFAGLAALALAMHLVVLLCVVPFGLASRLPGAIPVVRLTVLGVVLWMASLPLLAIHQWCARWIGLVGSVLLALIGTIAGNLAAEHGPWHLIPWAWPVRATVALNGTHANGVRLLPGDPAWATPIAPELALSLAVTSALVLLAVRARVAAQVGWGAALPGRASAGRRRATQRSATAPYRLTGAFWSEVTKLRNTPVVGYLLAAPVAAGVLAAWRHAPLAAWQGWALLVVPFASALLPAVAWTWEQEAWPGLLVRPVSPARLYAVKLALTWLLLNAAGGVLVVLVSFLGVPREQAVGMLALQAAVSGMLCALHLLVCLRFGTGASLALGIILTLLAVILGGSDLGGALWRFFPPVWTWSGLSQAAIWRLCAIAATLGGACALVGGRSAARRLPYRGDGE